MLKALSGFFLLVTGFCLAEIEGAMPIGIEAVTGYRTESIHRGFHLADDVFDFQLETGIALNNDWSANFGAWHATGTGEGNDFAEVSGFVDLRYDSQSYSAGWLLGYRDFSGSRFKDGWETGPFFTWRVNEDWDLNLEWLYDEGAEAYYGKAELEWSAALNDKSFITVTGGLSMVDDYYERNGWNDAAARFSYTYLIASNVSLTPFVGASIGLDGNADDYVYSGIWFEVTF